MFLMRKRLETQLNLLRFINRALLLLALSLFLSACTKSDEIDLERAKKLEEKGFFRIATSYYEKVRDRQRNQEKSLMGARLAANLSLYELKDFNRAIKNFKFLVLYSGDPSERASAQKAIANIYFDNLSDYDKAIVEFNRLLQMQHSSFDEADYRISIAKAYYHQGQLFQALSEANEVIRRSVRAEQRFDMLLLIANIKLALKDYSGASQQYMSLFTEFPDRSKKEDIHLSLVLTFEEMGEYQKAINTLGSMKDWYSQKDYIELRIKRLQERLQNQPKERLKK